MRKIPNSKSQIPIGRKIRNRKSKIGNRKFEIPVYAALPFALAIFLFCLSSFTFAQGVEFKLVTQKNVTDARELAIIKEELFLDAEAIDRVLITDVLNDGFDENDAMQLYPSGRVLRLQPITERLDSLLRSYRLPPNTSIFESRQFYAVYDSLSRYRHGGQALGYGLLGGIEERLQSGYRGETVEGYFKLSKSGSALQIWNFDSTRVSFPLPTATSADTAYIYVHDTVFVTESIQVQADTVRIRDTLYIPSDLLKGPRGVFYYRQALGLFGGSYSMAKREASRGKLTLGAGNEWDFGVWDVWVSGRQDVNSRIGLRFLADMAPWKTDTLTARFLGTSFEGMYIPAWDRSFFAFGGIRLFFDDDLFWDRARASWDEDLYEEDATQDLAQYELALKTGLDKFSPYGFGKRVGAWIRLSGWIPGAEHAGYDLFITPEALPNNAIPGSTNGVDWRWEHRGGYDVEGALTLALGHIAQLAASAGAMAMPNVNYIYSGRNSVIENSGLLRLGQMHQTLSLRFTPLQSEDSRLRFEASYRNNMLTYKLKQGNDKQVLEDLFFPYFETPEATGAVQVDANILQVSAGVKYFMPPDGLDAQLRPFAGLHFLFR